MYSRMNSPTDSMSSRTPWKLAGSSPGAGLLKPVETGSMNTRSVTSSSDSLLSAIWYGGGGAHPSSSSTTRRGPKAPMCSQADAEPGPPL